MRTKVTAKYLIAWENDSIVIYENGEMLYEGNEILEAGKKIELPYDRLVDYGNAIISPGFIDLDALGDIDHALFYEEQDNPEKLYWSRSYFEQGPREAMTAEEEAFKSQYAYAQLISHGITTAMPITCVYYKKAAETMEEIEAAKEHAIRLGLRTYLGPSYISAMHVYDEEDKRQKIMYMEEEGWKGLERAKEFARRFDGAGDGLIRGVMVPERIELQTEEILRETKKFARENKLLMRLHAAQGRFEYQHIQNTYHMSTIAYLDSIGLLDDKTLIPHALFTSGNLEVADQSDDDLAILLRNKTSVIHCPLVYSRNGRRLKSFGRFRKYGINVSMGTDTFPTDFFQNIRAGSSLAMTVDEDCRSNYYKEFYEAATIGGARALGREDLGRLCKGAKADFIVVDMSRFHMGVMDDPIRTMCMCANGRDVKYVVINGRTVLDNGILPDFDYEMVQEKAQRYYEKLKQSFIGRSSFPEAGFYQYSYPIR